MLLREIVADDHWLRLTAVNTESRQQQPANGVAPAK